MFLNNFKIEHEETYYYEICGAIKLHEDEKKMNYLNDLFQIS